jgi:hypothetical protein
MEYKCLYNDIDGELMQFKGKEGIQYCKKLSLDTFWYIQRYEDIELYLDNLIKKTNQIDEEKCLVLEYSSDIIPLNLDELNEIIHQEPDFASWRLVRIALDIAHSLKLLHDSKIPQQFVTPRRIGIQNKKFVILPTLAGFLPQFTEIAKRENNDWLFFASPEIIRTRAFSENSLYQADIYSFGKFILTLCYRNREIPEIPNIYDFISNLVEGKGQPIKFDDLPHIEDFIPLINKMCNIDPSKRPEIEDVILDLNRIEQKVIPAEIVRDYKKHIDVDKIGTLVEKLLNSDKFGAFDFYHGQAYLLLKELELEKKPVEYNRAISWLNKYIKLYPEDVNAYKEIARTYKNNTSHSTYLENSSFYYETAGILSDWSIDVVTEFAEVLEKHPNPAYKLEITQKIDNDKRIADIYIIRAQANFQLKEYLAAWYELERCFEKYGNLIKAYNLACEIAVNLPNENLLKWISLKKSEVNENLDPMFEIILTKMGPDKF